MAKFCTNCGKPLEEGKVCDCKKNAEKKEIEQSANSIVEDYFHTFLEIVKGIFTKPVTTIKEYSTKENFGFACIALLVNAIISGLFMYCYVKEGTNAVGSIFGYGSLVTANINVSFVEILLQGMLFMLVGFVVSAGMIYLLAGPLFKSNMDFKKVISLTGVCSIFTLITTLIAIIFVFISMKLATILLLVAGAFYFTYLYHGMTEISNLDKNKMAYVYVPALSVAAFVVVYILPKILF